MLIIKIEVDQAEAERALQKRAFHLGLADDFARNMGIYLINAGVTAEFNLVVSVGEDEQKTLTAAQARAAKLNALGIFKQIKEKLPVKDILGMATGQQANKAKRKARKAKRRR